jgi:CheY-like chemotaxis protein
MEGNLGLELAYQHRPDLILLDLHLPGIQGEKLLDRLKADARTRDIPVVVVSADATPARIKQLLASGAHAYLAKPLNIPDLLETVDEVLGEERAA